MLGKRYGKPYAIASLNGSAPTDILDGEGRSGSTSAMQDGQLFAFASGKLPGSLFHKPVHPSLMTTHATSPLANRWSMGSERFARGTCASSPNRAPCSTQGVCLHRHCGVGAWDTRGRCRARTWSYQHASAAEQSPRRPGGLDEALDQRIG